MPDLRVVDTNNNNQYPENLGYLPGYMELGILGTNTPGAYPFHVDSSGNLTANTVSITQVNAQIVPSIAQGYTAWTYDPSLSIAAGVSINATTFAALVYVEQSFTTSNVDWVQVSGTPNVTCGLWPATAPAGVLHPLAWTTAAAASAAAVNTQAWNTSVALTAGTSYMLTIFGSTTGVAACVTSIASAANAAAGSLYSTTTTYRAATVGTLGGTLSAASVFGTSTLSASFVWFGLH